MTGGTITAALTPLQVVLGRFAECMECADQLLDLHERESFVDILIVRAAHEARRLWDMR